MVEQMDDSKLSASSQIQSSADGAENDKQQKCILDKQDQYLRTNVIDVFGNETEPICDYLRCHHKVPEHVNVNVNIHVTALLEHTFYYIIINIG